MPEFSGGHRNDPELIRSKTLAGGVAGSDLFELVEVSGAGCRRLSPPAVRSSASSAALSVLRESFSRSKAVSTIWAETSSKFFREGNVRAIENTQ